MTKFAYEYVKDPAGVIAIIMIVILGVVEVMVFKERIPEHKKYFWRQTFYLRSISYFVFAEVLGGNFAGKKKS